MELAGINANTVSPAGGEIVKDKNGVVLGILEETASGLVSSVYGEYLRKQSLAERKATWQRSMALAEEECLKKGVTTFHDAGSSFQDVEWMKELAAANKLKVRHWVMIRASNHALRYNLSAFTTANDKNDHLTVRAIKVSIDGALGSYGAWLLEPYSDRAGWVGQPTFNSDSLRRPIVK
jgi:predicted amidohydrolase YtcJ